MTLFWLSLAVDWPELMAAVQFWVISSYGKFAHTNTPWTSSYEVKSVSLKYGLLASINDVRTSSAIVDDGRLHHLFASYASRDMARRASQRLLIGGRGKGSIFRQVKSRFWPLFLNFYGFILSTKVYTTFFWYNKIPFKFFSLFK